MDEGLDDLGRRQAHIERRTDVHLELRLATTEGGEHAQCDQLPLARCETGAGVDVAEAVGHDVLGQRGCDVRQRLQDALTGFAVDGRQGLKSSFVPIRFGGRPVQDVSIAVGRTGCHN